MKVLLHGMGVLEYDMQASVQLAMQHAAKTSEHQGRQ